MQSVYINGVYQSFVQTYYVMSFDGVTLKIFFFLFSSLDVHNCRSNLKLTHFPINNHDPSKILKMFEIKVHLKKCIYLDYNLTVRLFK